VAAASTGTFYGRAMTAMHIYTVAGTGTAGFSGDGGPATSAELRNPDGVAVDGAGNLLIADTSNDRIRVVAASTGTFYGRAMTAGDIYTVAGTGTFGFSGDGGAATNADLGGPDGVAVDGAGNLLIADTDNNRVRVAAASTGNFYGRAMTAMHTYTVAGTGTAGFSRAGGRPPSTDRRNPAAVGWSSLRACRMRPAAARRTTAGSGRARATSMRNGAADDRRLNQLFTQNTLHPVVLVLNERRPRAGASGRGRCGSGIRAPLTEAGRLA